MWLEKRYVGSRHTSEWFNTAGRNVKTGLIASVIVSQVSITLFLLAPFAQPSFFFNKSPMIFLKFVGSGRGLRQSCKARMLHGSTESVVRFGMPVVPLFRLVN